MLVYHVTSIILLFFWQFEESMIVYDACRLIRERVPDAAQGQRKRSLSLSLSLSRTHAHTHTHTFIDI